MYRHAFAQLLFWCAFYYLMPAISALIAADTAWSISHISVTFTLAFLVWAFCAPLIGASIDRGFGGITMLAGGITGVVTLLFLSTVTSPWAFSASLLVLGICMAATLYDPCFALMMRKLDDNGTDATATVTLVAGFATLVTFPLVLALSSALDWQSIILVFAAFAACAVYLLPQQDRVATKDVPRDNAQPFKFNKALIMISLAFGLVMLGHAALLFLLPIILSQTSDAGKMGMIAVSILGPAQIAGRLVWKAYGGNYVPQYSAIVLFLALCAPTLILMVSGPNTGFVYVALIIQGACYGVHTILRPVLARLYLPIEHIGRGLGGIATIGLVMMALGPAFGGLVWGRIGFTGLMSCIFVLNAIALCLIVILFRHRTRKEAL